MKNRANAREQLNLSLENSLSPSTSLHSLWLQLRENSAHLSDVEEIEFLQALKSYHTVLTENPGLEPAKIEGLFLKKELSKYGLRLASEDFVDTLRGGEIIEGYNLQNRQIFRNFEYFKYCSYSVADLLQKSWDELFLREAHIVQQMMETVQEVLSSESLSVREAGIPRHRLKETGGLGYQFEVDFLYGVSLLDHEDRKVGYVVSEYVRRLKADNVVDFQ